MLAAGYHQELIMSRALFAFSTALTLSFTVATAIAQERTVRDAGARQPDQVETYKTIGDTKLAMEIYLPPGHKPTDRRPAMVFFFGGGWNSGTTKQFAHQAGYLASRGMVAIAADYRVYSRHQARVVDCIADAKSAIRWTRANASRLGIDPDKIASAGGSAGGHLAAAVATLDNFDEPGEDKSVSSRPNAIALFNPALNLAPEAFGPQAESKSKKDKRTPVAARLGATAAEVSPTVHVKAGVPPAIVFHGEADMTVPYAQAKEFTERMTAAGNRCELVGYPGKGHGFFNVGRGDGQGFPDTLRRLDGFLGSLGYLQGAPQVDQYVASIKPAATTKPAQ
jgi:acetyl esterase